MEPAERPPLTRAAIVATARELIREAGVDQLSLRKLGSRLGVTATALYAHIETKQDLLRAVAAGEFARLLEAYEAGADLADPLDRIRFHSRTYVDFARAEPDLFAVLFVFAPAQTADQVPEAFVLSEATAAFSLAAEAIDDAIASGQLETDDPQVLALALWSAAHGVASVLQLGLGLPRELEDRVIDEVTDRLLAGYRPTDATGGSLQAT